MDRIVGYDEIDSFVSANPNLSWEGWDVLALKKNHAGWMRKNGYQKNGVWYIKTRISPDSATGNWTFPKGAF